MLLLHVLEYIFVFGVNLTLLLPQFLHQASKHSILIEKKSLVARKKQRLVHLQEFKVGVYVVIIVLWKFIPVPIECQLPFVHFKKVA